MELWGGFIFVLWSLIILCKKFRRRIWKTWERYCQYPWGTLFIFWKLLIWSYFMCDWSSWWLVNKQEVLWKHSIMLVFFLCIGRWFLWLPTMLLSQSMLFCWQWSPCSRFLYTMWVFYYLLDFLWDIEQDITLWMFSFAERKPKSIKTLHCHHFCCVDVSYCLLRHSLEKPFLALACFSLQVCTMFSPSIHMDMT